MPPPPCELSRIPRPSMLEGLQKKFVGYGLVLVPDAVQSAVDSNLVFVGNAAPVVAPSASLTPVPLGNFTPLPRTVIAAPSYAPIRLGSLSCSARLPFSVASHPRVASNGRRSTTIDGKFVHTLPVWLFVA